MVDRLSILEMPWVFSQSHPLTTSSVVGEAKKRGVLLDSWTLRELYRQGDLVPIAEVTSRAVRPPAGIAYGPPARGSLLVELQQALIGGRIRDPDALGFRPRLRFDSRKTTDPLHWWNGLIYSPWQLLAVPNLRPRLALRRVIGPRERRRVVLPPLNEWTKPQADQVNRWALALTVLKARYLPTIDREWLHLTNAEVETWQEYRTLYDPMAAAESSTSRRTRCVRTPSRC
jgi:hypothetical protein